MLVCGKEVVHALLVSIHGKQDVVCTNGKSMTFVVRKLYMHYWWWRGIKY